MSNIKEVAQKYSCECCAYCTDRKPNFTRHMVSKKHIKKSNGEETSSIDEPKPKTRKPRTPKINVVVAELPVQNSSDDETIISEFTIEYESDNESVTENDFEKQIKELKEMYEKQINELKEENELLKDNVELLKQEKEELQQEINYLNEDNSKNDEQLESLKNDNETLKYQKKMLEEKIIHDLNCQIQDMIEIIKDKKMLEQFENQVKFECDKEKSNDEIIVNLRNKIDEIREFMYDNIKNIEQPKQFIEQPKQIIEQPKQIIEQPNIQIVIEPIVEKPKKKLILSKVQIEEPKIIIDEPVLENKIELEILKKLEKLENQIQIQKPKKTKKSPKNYENESVIRMDRDVNNYRDKKHLMFQNKFKKLCRNSKYNKFIKYYNYTDDDGINRNVMLPSNLSILEMEGKWVGKYMRGNQNIIYEDAFKSLLSNVNYRHIPFICTNQRNTTFKILDFDNDGEWMEVNRVELIDYIKPYINILWETFNESINNLVKNDDINNEVMKQLYDIPNKKHFLTDTARYQYVLANTINPFNDDESYGNEQKESELFEACLINYIKTTFTMSNEYYTPPEEYNESIDREIDYSQNFNNVSYETYHNKPLIKYVRTSNVWNDED